MVLLHECYRMQNFVLVSCTILLPEGGAADGMA